MLRTTLVVLSLAAFTLAGCGGGGGSTVADTPAPQPIAAQPVNPGGGTSGGVAAGQAALTWSQPAGLAANTWHWTATNPSGTVMLATSIPGDLYISRDNGASWTAQAALPANAMWISADLRDDGQAIVAVALNGGMYRTRDGGASWSRIDTAFNASENLDYESVTVSGDGTHIVAVVMGGATAGGAIWASTDGTADAPTFAAATLEGGATLASWWRAVDSDASGTRVVAASHNGDVWVSNDSGATFAPLPIAVAGTAVQDGWYRLALSRDGNTLALAGNEEFGAGVAAGQRSSGLYVGRFAAGGWTFARASDVTGNYTRVAIAANAPVLAATLSGANGGALVSSNGGASFAPLSTPAGETAWRSIAITGDASHAVLAAGTFFGTPGNLYVSSGPLSAAAQH
jgi:hypothetical protein